MKLFLHLKILSGLPTFQSGIGLWSGEHLADVHYFDVDNHSAPLVINTAKQAVDKARCVFVLIESTPEHPGPLLSIVKHLAQFEKKHPLKIVQQGTNPLLRKLERGFSQPWIEKIDEPNLCKALKSFFNAG